MAPVRTTTFLTLLSLCLASIAKVRLLMFPSAKSILGNTTVLVVISTLAALSMERCSCLRETEAMSQPVSARRTGGCICTLVEVEGVNRLSERDRKSSPTSEPWSKAPEWLSLRCCGEEQAYARAILALARELARAPCSSSFAAAACTIRARLGLRAGRSAPWWLLAVVCAGAGGRRLRLVGVGSTSTTAESSPPSGRDASTFLCFCGLGGAAAAGQDSRPMRRATTPGAAPSAAPAAAGWSAGGGGGAAGGPGHGSLRGEERSEEGSSRRGEKSLRLRARRRCQSRRWKSTPPAQPPPGNGDGRFSTMARLLLIPRFSTTCCWCWLLPTRPLVSVPATVPRRAAPGPRPFTEPCFDPGVERSVAGTQRRLALLLHLGTRCEGEGPARQQDRSVGPTCQCGRR